MVATCSPQSLPLPQVDLAPVPSNGSKKKTHSDTQASQGPCVTLLPHHEQEIQCTYIYWSNCFIHKQKEVTDTLSSTGYWQLTQRFWIQVDPDTYSSKQCTIIQWVRHQLHIVQGQLSLLYGVAGCLLFSDFSCIKVYGEMVRTE